MGYFSPLPELDNELGGVGVRQPGPGQHVVLGRGVGLVLRVVLREPAGGEERHVVELDHSSHSR